MADHVEGRKKEAEQFFLKNMSKALKNINEKSNDEFPSCIYYAFKQNEIEKEGLGSPGWATFLQSVLDAQLSVILGQ